MNNNTLLLLNAVMRQQRDCDRLRGLKYLKRARLELDKEINRLEELQEINHDKAYTFPD